MEAHSFVGYSPKLYEALQILAYQEFQYETCDSYPPQQNCHPVDHRLHYELCLRALIGDSAAYEEIEAGYGAFYLEQLFLQMDDVNLRDLIRSGRLLDLKFNKDGFYMAVLEEKDEA